MHASACVSESESFCSRLSCRRSKVSRPNVPANAQQLRRVAVASQMPTSDDYWLCSTCAVQTAFKASQQPPEVCPICDDERQYVGMQGQSWTTPSELAKGHRSVVSEEELGLLGIGLEPSVGIGQRSLLVRTRELHATHDLVPNRPAETENSIAKRYLGLPMRASSGQ